MRNYGLGKYRVQALPGGLVMKTWQALFVVLHSAIQILVGPKLDGWRAFRVGLLSLPIGLALHFPAYATFAKDSERRVALVIGNQEYKYVEPLKNPRNDTREISRILREADFEVTIGMDLDKRELESVLRRFLRELRDGDTALFYYSGHAVQVGEANFILPVDAKLSSKYALPFESQNVSYLLDYMKDASSLQIVILDACRDNPFEIASVFWGEQEYSLGKTRGLGRIRDKLGSFISYATRPGEVAYDGKGPMSPFTTSVVNNALDPSLEIKELMTKVQDEVVRKTGGRQTPYHQDSRRVTSFYFVQPKPKPVVTAHHSVSIAAGKDGVALKIPEPVQPEGGLLQVTLTLSPDTGQLRLTDGRTIAQGDRINAAQLASLEFVPTGASPGDIEMIGYTVEDEWGGSATATISITIVKAEDDVADEERQERLAATLNWLKETANDGAVDADIGVGPQPIYADAPVDGLPATSNWLKVVSVDSDLQLSSDNRLLEAGDRFPVSDLAALTVRPQVGSQTEASRFKLELPVPSGKAPETITQVVQPGVTQCDRLATQPLDLQAVTEGRLTNELDAAAVEQACKEAMAAWPAEGRFVFQRGRGAFAAGDLVTAFSYFEQAYQLGHVRAGHSLGNMYLFGAGIDRDLEKAVALYRKGAERGDPYALYSLGMAQIRGTGTQQDEKAGLENLLQSVQAGHTFSFNAIGTLYLSGKHVEQNTERAVYYFEQAASRDDIYGYRNMGTLYRDGKGVPKDYDEAMRWFKKAHDGGHPAAGTAIGLLYYNGQGVEKDDAEATRWFRESAERGDHWGPTIRLSCLENSPLNPPP